MSSDGWNPCELVAQELNRACVPAALVPEAVPCVRGHGDRVSNAQLVTLAGDLEDERPLDDLCSAHLLGMDMDGLSLRGGWVHALDSEQLGAKLEKRHPLAGARVRDLLALARHETAPYL
jgi:hypothetical protein